MTSLDAHPSPRRQALHRAITLIGILELAIGAVSLVVIFVFMLIQAGQRYLPFEGFAWTGEISRFALIWLTFSAMGLLVTARGHIALEVADTIKNPRVVRAIQVFALIVVAAVAIGLTVSALDLVESQGIVKSPVLRIPMSFVYIPVLIGSISTAIRAVVAAVDIARHGPVLPQGAGSEPEAEVR
ncbi:TRAP transporter small permease [Protaetiibacter mangrovi]|uniref:TRAP transporter small permease subunit n=1 Tax=Protaetiibacter mangrovi TaxID=2970926 RepID=A0ABT1ZHY4_9MICO|nr:TRAP transporter small permease subunit [Protaetiibacter mangrovi]MCS0500324.1 TRAP transporter small permease subunit [Protaetiibacter mangrovi]